MIVAKLIAGICALLLGRRLFWLFVGVLGFSFGVELAAQLLRGSPPLLVLVIGIAVGLVGAAVAYLVQEALIAITGFGAGVYLVLLLSGVPAPAATGYFWVACLVGGVVGALAFVVLFDWGLILFSSAVGAGLIVEALSIRLPAATMTFLVLVLVGVILQSEAMRRRPPVPRRRG